MGQTVSANVATEEQLEKQLEEPADDATVLTVALACEETAAAAAMEIYQLVGQGEQLGDEMREAGAIPGLVAVAKDITLEASVGDGIGLAAEFALGALAHLGMQKTANHEALCAAGGLPVLFDIIRSLPPEDQCARYAESLLTIMAMSSQSAHVKQEVIDAAVALPDDTLEHYRELAIFVGRGEHMPCGTLANDAFVGLRACAICTEEIECDQPTRALPCGHCYHYSCVTDWLRYGSTCPTCRFAVRPAIRRRQL